MGENKMKCDELKEYYYYEDRVITPATHLYRVYHADKVDAAIAELKQKLENVQASAYAESVDAGMRERRLRRALWLARANSARNSYLKWNLFANFESEEKLFTIDEYDETPGATDGQVLRTYTEWMKTWKNVERKCRAKAEEYK